VQPDLDGNISLGLFVGKGLSRLAGGGFYLTRLQLSGQVAMLQNVWQWWQLAMGIFFVFLAFKATAMSYGPIRKGAAQYPPNVASRILFGLFGLILIVMAIVSISRR
jgi:hypothetical protein